MSKTNYQVINETTAKLRAETGKNIIINHWTISVNDTKNESLGLNGRDRYQIVERDQYGSLKPYCGVIDRDGIRAYLNGGK